MLYVTGKDSYDASGKLEVYVYEAYHILDVVVVGDFILVVIMEPCGA